MTITYVLPLRTVSLANQREHWAKRARRVKAERMAATFTTPRGVALPCTVTLTRVAPRALDGDNAQGALKAVRDGIADRLGVDDRDVRVDWLYQQERGKPKEYAVRIQIESA